jgi:hypothetical protein
VLSPTLGPDRAAAMFAEALMASDQPADIVTSIEKAA